MVSFLEKYEAAKKAVHPEKLVISGAIGTISLPVLVPLQSFLTYLVHEVGEHLSNEQMQLIAVAMIGIANIVSVALETKALEEKFYSASVMSTAIKVFIRNSMGIAAAGHLINFTQVFLANPVQILNVLSVQAGSGSRPFIENALGVTLALSAWKLVFNAIILQVDTSVLKVPAQKVYDKFRPNNTVNARNDIDLLQ